MGTALITRRDSAPHPGFVIPAALERKQELKPLEKLWVHQDWAFWLPASLIGTTWGIIGWASHWSPLAFWITLSVLSAIIGIISVGAAIGRIDEDHQVGLKKNIIEDRGRKRAPHAGDRVGRKADVPYQQYSVKAVSEGTSIKFILVEHSDPGRFWYWNTHRETKKSYGSWGEDIGALAVLTDPTLETVQEQLLKWQEVAATLEENSYQEALKKREIKRLALEAN